MDAKFSQEVKDVISNSREEALRLRHPHIGIEHLVLGLIREGEGMAIRVLKSMNIDTVLMRKAIEDAVKDNATVDEYRSNTLPLTPQAEKVLKITILEAKLHKSDVVGTEHLMLSILKNKDNVATRVLNRFEVDYDSFKAELQYLQNQPGAELTNDPEEEFEEEKGRSYGEVRRRPGNVKSKTPVLDNFGRDIDRKSVV